MVQYSYRNIVQIVTCRLRASLKPRFHKVTTIALRNNRTNNSAQRLSSYIAVVC
jgi:hypothetical protein